MLPVAVALLRHNDGVLGTRIGMVVVNIAFQDSGKLLVDEHATVFLAFGHTGIKMEHLFDLTAGVHHVVDTESAYLRNAQACSVGQVEDGLVAAEAAEIVGHHRAEVIARRITQMASYEMGDLTLARENLEALRVLVRHLGSKRFEPGLLELEAILHRAEGRRSEAVKILEQGIEICSETGMRFLGPRLLAQLALATDDADARRKALADGEELLREGSLGHNHLLFHRDAIEACLNVGEWDRVERYASALEEYTRPEPLAWSDFFIARGRAIAAWGVGRRDEATAAELARLRDEAEDAGLKIALPALEAVLAGG